MPSASSDAKTLKTMQMAREMMVVGSEQRAKRLAQRQRLRSLGGAASSGVPAADADPAAEAAQPGRFAAGAERSAVVNAAGATAMRSATDRIKSEKAAAAVLAAVLSMAQCGVLSWAYFSTGDPAVLLQPISRWTKAAVVAESGCDSSTTPEQTMLLCSGMLLQPWRWHL
jgi:hypothetical protein